MSTLGVVLDADATLRFPDFRAEERTFALIAQLAGRVGRGGEGRVLVQTIAPEARSILHAARHDSDGFLAGELERRAALRYPPFSHLIRIVCSAADARPARGRARRCASACASAAPARFRASVLGPAAAVSPARPRAPGAASSRPPTRRPRCAPSARRCSGWPAQRSHAGVSFSVDVDPQ